MSTTTSIKNAGTTSTTAVKALQWMPSSQAPGATTGLQWTTDLQTMMAYASLQGKGPSGIGSKKVFPIPRISNGVLYIEGYGSLLLQDKTSVNVQPADWLVVDPITGWAQVIPDSVFTAGGSVWSHS